MNSSPKGSAPCQELVVSPILVRPAPFTLPNPHPAHPAVSRIEVLSTEGVSFVGGPFRSWATDKNALGWADR